MRCLFKLKQKKSSSDIQELIQFEEKIKRDIKQQILQDLEIKQKAVNKVAVEGVVETLVEQKKEKDNFWTLLGKCSRLFAALSSISIVIVGILVYAYLADINSRHLLVNIISQPSFFLSVVILFSVLMLIIAIPVYMPFVIAGYITSELFKDNPGNEENITKARKIAYVISISSIILIGIISIMLIIFKKEILSFTQILEFWFILSFFFIILLFVCVTIVLMWWLTRETNVSVSTWFLSMPIYSSISVAFPFYILFALSMSANWFSYDSTFLFYLVLFALFILVSAVFASSLVGFGKLAEKKEDEHKVKKKMWFSPLAIVIFFSLLSFTQEGAKFKQHLFQNLSYIETPEQARWYLLDKRYLEWNNLSKINSSTRETLGPLKINYPLWRNKLKFLPEWSQNSQNNLSAYPDNALF